MPWRNPEDIAEGGGGGDVSSVFGRTGAVSAVVGDYDTSKVTAAGDNLYITSAEKSKLSGVESGAQVNVAGLTDMVSDSSTLVVNRSLVAGAGGSTYTVPSCATGDVITLFASDDYASSAITLNGDTGVTIDGNSSYSWDEQKTITLRATGANTWVKSLAPDAGAATLEYGAYFGNDYGVTDASGYLETSAVISTLFGDNDWFVAIKVGGEKPAGTVAMTLFSTDQFSFGIYGDGTYFTTHGLSGYLITPSPATRVYPDDYIVISFDASAGAYSAWVNGDKVVNASTSGNVPSPTAPTETTFGKGFPSSSYNKDATGFAMKNIYVGLDTLTDSEAEEFIFSVTALEDLSSGLQAKVDNGWKGSKTGFDTEKGGVGLGLVGNKVSPMIIQWDPVPTLSDASMSVNNDESKDFGLATVLTNPRDFSVTYEKVSGESWMGSPNASTGVLSVDGNGQSVGDYTGVYSVTGDGNTDNMTLTVSVTDVNKLINEGWANLSSWTVVNGTSANDWVVGSAASSVKDPALYVSNDGGTTWAYSTGGNTDTVHVYQDVTIPVGATECRLLFPWICNGESSYDYMRVYIAPTSVTPTAGTEVSTQYNVLGVFSSDKFNLQTSLQTEDIDVSSLCVAGSTVRVVISWKNDSSGGSQPPAAVGQFVLQSDV